MDPATLQAIMEASAKTTKKVLEPVTSQLESAAKSLKDAATHQDLFNATVLTPITAAFNVETMTSFNRLIDSMKLFIETPAVQNVITQLIQLANMNFEGFALFLTAFVRFNESINYGTTGLSLFNGEMAGINRSVTNLRNEIQETIQQFRLALEVIKQDILTILTAVSGYNKPNFNPPSGTGPGTGPLLPPGTDIGSFFGTLLKPQPPGS